ncbi:MAG: restriction endonuclease subunit S [Lachnospiraceae bacterium]|nr:restriction endonuclease subunit S [Lachnospiraceae bacterium]
MGNWKTCTIGELGTVIGGATPSTKESENYEGGTIAWITPKDLASFSGRYISHGERNITEKGLQSCSTQLMPAHTVLFSSRAPIGYVAIAKQEVCTNQGFKSVVPNANTDYMFLYYLLKYSKEKIENLGSGTTFKEVSGSVMRDVKVSIPETVEEQRQIASVLSALDDKIERNIEINDNLQQQAQVIYASMFVTNANPDWQQGHLSDLITVKYGKDHKKLADGTYPVYGSGGIMRYVECPLYDRESVLIPRKGTLNNVMYVNHPFWSVDTMFYTEMRLPNVAKYVYHLVKAKDLASMNAGSAVPSMTTDILNAMEVTIPSASVLEEFERTVAPMYSAIQENKKQSKKLAELRDTLLPKLISGKIDVSNIQL